MLAWGPMRSLLAAQHLTYDWLTSVRATVVDASADVCAHGKPMLQTRLDCFFPKYINGLFVDAALVQQYADAKTFLEESRSSTLRGVCWFRSGSQDGYDGGVWKPAFQGPRSVESLASPLHEIWNVVAGSP